MVVLNLCLKRKIREDGRFKFHPGCEKLNLTHLCFVDDLLMFCKYDLHSIRLIKEALDEFGSYSGLMPNVAKSTCYLGGITAGEKDLIADIMPFANGKLPVKYLGLPLLASRLKCKDCMPLIDKVRTRIEDWKNKSLSFDGRLQLIQSVLASLNIYWMSIFLLPKSVIYDTEILMRNFLWSGSGNNRGIAKLAWKDVCNLKAYGGLGIKSLSRWNKILMSKHIWGAFRLKFFSCLGNGDGTSFWFDFWHPSGPLSSLICNMDIFTSRLGRNCMVSSCQLGDIWVWPWDLLESYDVKLSCFVPELVLNKADVIKWRTCDGSLVDYSVGEAWRDFNVGRLPTQDRLERWGIQVDQVCPLCSSVKDSHDHLFIECSYTKLVWSKFRGKAQLDNLIELILGGTVLWADVINFIA
ncbi:uncharacterized protein [Rutidosis leptorrhynchoides]|uniref:uncharacterized protein n=1 Tax=Rutidosis leptorrhynchoides TaxID=125765 RepID=UPI003A99FE84